MKTFRIGSISNFTFGLKYKLLISYIIVIVIPVLIGAFFPYVFTESIIVKDTDESLRFSVDKIVESIKYKMEKYTEFSNKISDDPSIKEYITADYSGNEGAAYNAAFEIFNKFTKERRNNSGEISNIKIYKNNDTLPNYGDYLFDEKAYADSEWYKDLNGNSGVSFWKYGVQKPFGGREFRTISLISWLEPSNNVGFLEIELYQEKILNSIYKFNYKKGSMIGVLDEKGKTIAINNLQNNAFEQLLPYIRGKLDNKSKESYMKKINEEEYLILNRILNFQGWRVVAIVPLKELWAPINNIKLITSITALSCIVVFILVTVLISDLLTNRLKKLAKRMKSVEAGNFDVTMSIRGNDEISELTRVFNGMVESTRNLINEVYISKIEKKEAELRALQEQINPHFLYNTLSSINWLAVQANAPRIVNIVEALAAFYRLSLNKGKEMIPLKDELAQVKAYVSIQKLRYEDSFDVYFEVDPAIENAIIIKFIIQPFIENAIVHGLNENMQGSIYVTAREIEEKKILIRIIDNGRGMDEQKLRTFTSVDVPDDQTGKLKGYGIKNVNERIKIHYGDEFGVSISSKAGEGTIVNIMLPYVDGGDS
jgi:two-component system sensor histidine kinase YesM